MDRSWEAGESRIRVLPEVVQNKIAAGEVVERPASVVKELVENALDAGAGRVVVELVEGGRRLVRVTDDGRGMGEADLALCVERHATSKIADVDDIFHVSSLGFRGEALPSIAAVSRLSISTALPAAKAGNRLVREGGGRARIMPAAPTPGTTVQVRDLFFNTPARLKFMKSPGAETSAAATVVTRLALAHPGTAFRLLADGRELLNLPATEELEERLLALLGRELAGRLLPVSAVAGPELTISGYVARPPESRPNSRGIYTFLNRRWIRHPGCVRVVRDAFQGALAPRRFPLAVIFLRADPTMVDVNVHPAKEEVRFADDRLFTGNLRRAVDAALVADARGVVRRMEGGTGVAGPRRHAADAAAPGSAVSEAVRGYAARARSRIDPRGKPGGGRGGGFMPRAAIDAGRPPAAAAKADPAGLAGDAADTVVPRPLAGMDSAGSLRPVAQVGDRYLVVESAAGVSFIDQHALHERWNYEQLLRRDVPAMSQGLLTPLVLELAPAQAALADEVLPLLRDAGFRVDRFGKAAISVSAAPTIIPPGKVEQVVRDTFRDLEQGERALEGLRERVCAGIACRAAVLAGKRLSPSEQVALLEQFARARKPLTCPHGRPTTFTLTWEELARRFGRR